MLETHIQELTAAVRELTKLLDRFSPTQGLTGSNVPEVVKETKPKKETVKAVEPAPEIPNEKQPTTTDTSQPSESESAPVTYDDVKKVTNALSAAKGRDTTIAVLSRFGVKKATELDEAQWADYIEHAQKVVDGEADE